MTFGLYALFTISAVGYLKHRLIAIKSIALFPFRLE